MSVTPPPPEILSRFPEVSWKRRDIEPFGALYMRAEDTLIWRAFSIGPGIPLTLRGRILLPDGTINAIQDTLTPTGDNLVTSKVVPLTEGWLISLEVINTSGVIGFTGLYTTIDLNRGTIAGVEAIGLISGYVATSTRISSWPFAQIGAPASFSGYMDNNSPANPAAGADITFVQQTNTRAFFMSFTAILTTGAAVANRQVHIVLDDGANQIYNHPALAVQVASTAVRYVFAAGVAALTTTDGVQVVPIPPRYFLRSLHRIRTLTTALQAADQWSAAQLLNEEWFDRTA